MIRYVRQLINNQEIRRKLLFTLFIIFIFRILANIPLPGIDMGVYQQQFGSVSTAQANLFLSIFTGGLLDTPSIVGLGIGVYITASIIIQLLSSVIPQLEELSKDGQRGKQVMDQYTRYLTIPLSIMYSVGYLLLISQQTLGFDANGNAISLIPAGADGVTVTKIAFMSLTLTAGAILIMWLAELVTESGIANGASIMIMLGILATIPALIQSDLSQLNISEVVSNAISQQNLAALNDPAIITVAVFIIGAVLLVGSIIWVTESTRKLPIQYARRQRSGAVQESFLPLKLNQTGVMPIIFASSLLTVPQLVVPVALNLLDATTPIGNFFTQLQTSFLFDSSTPAYNMVYFVLIVMFALFYVFIAFKPDQVAENLQKSGGFIPGVRPGKSTEDYITKVLIRLTLVGALFLGFIALVPVVAGNLMRQISAQPTSSFSVFSAIGGTSILIVVGVILEMLRQIEALKASQNYDKYI